MISSLRKIIVTFSISFVAMLTSAAQAVVPLPLEEYEYSVEQIAHMRSQADQGDSNAQYWMGNLYYYGQGVPSDYIQSAYWYKKANASGVSTVYELTRITDFMEKHVQLYAAAKSGKVEALYEFANHQPHNATGLEGDAPRPHWLLLAAQKGHTYSQSDIGDLYFKAYYKRRIEAAHTEQSVSRYWLRTPLDFDKESLETDLPNAIYWLEKAAKNGDGRSDLRLINASAEYMSRSWALMVDRGSSAPNGPCDVLFSGKLRAYPVDRSSDIWLIKYDRAPDYERARACYEAADDPDAWYRLGIIYHGGNGIPRDDVKAASYLTRALQSQSYRAAAAYEMALIYSDSLTVSKDESEAYTRLNEAIAWLDRASSSNCNSPWISDTYDRLEELNSSVRRNAQQAYESLANRISKKNLVNAKARLLAEGILKTESATPPIPSIMPCM